MLIFLKKIYKDESGATAIEYGLIAALISVGVITAVTDLGDAVRSLFNRNSDELDTITLP